MNREIKIITLGDIFKNIETEEKAFEFLNYIQNLQQEKTRIRKILIEHIENARYELNVILHSDNDLDYKNECSKVFELLNKNIRIILNKIDNITGGDE